MIVRLMNEGQYRVGDELLERLNALDDEAAAALERDDESALDARLDEMWRLVRSEGEALPADDLSASDVLIPPSDLTLAETRALFADDGSGLIPDIPSA
ncbi:MAG: PspA-associated protein PspAA [Pseudomonadota bacterium]